MSGPGSETESARPPAARARLVAAFAAVYLVWGSSYLAIRFAIETIPPFLMGGTRFLIAGTILYTWERLRGAGRPGTMEWRSAGVIGALMILCGNGAVVWAEQFVASGLAALLIATEPLWIVILLWGMGRERVGGVESAGLALGFAGVLFLIGPEDLGRPDLVDPAGALALLFASLAWAAGSLYSRHAPQPPSQTLATGMSMIAGGGLMLALGVAGGELPELDPAAMSGRSLAAFAYLIVFPSMVAFNAYLWLLKNTTPARASTYAYVNPVIAVALGWAMAGEPISLRIVISAAIIILSVWFMIRRRHI